MADLCHRGGWWACRTGGMWADDTTTFSPPAMGGRRGCLGLEFGFELLGSPMSLAPEGWPGTAASLKAQENC
ncbi:hypothetical protein BDA96_08G139600 [Sorghum bicolor]|uniref:Uncharacterized protein n=1 Tax=Sorghum bicolor TaxID=4558 RepID=A0A921U813_SORBI|nr:hypothetical protein BDA96_08G139600 [Sorghum bicolor]